MSAATDTSPAPAAIAPYFEAWNRHDAAALVASFAPGGMYRDPLAPDGVTGEAIGAYAAGLWGAFPDLRFDLVSLDALDNRRLAVQWRMRGTNSGPFNGLPPTGRRIDVPGADFIELEDGGIRLAQGYFDSGEVPRQLGLQIRVQPARLGPLVFGTSAWASSGKRVKPGEYTFTMLEARDEQEVEQVRQASLATVRDMLEMPGFIEWTGIIVGTRMMTVTAWERPGDSRQMTRSAVHQQASRQYYGGGLSAGGVFAWLRPERLLVNARCPACGHMVREADGKGACECGAPLPDGVLPW
ncbi:MAG TPA: nuclear transport factor 2 family protein [Roseiflexaceae bacterium]|nr:nuclear transport factor 2 family protein [Roseiflexaceae bacterium]